ncbi:MAG: hypothetical protein U0359_14480 [Byssovorax sp.]
MKKAAPPPVVPAAELRLALLDTIKRLGKAVSPGDLRKALPKAYKRTDAELAALLDEQVRAGSLFALKDGKITRYADRDPGPTVAAIVQIALRDGPLDKKQLVAQVKRAAPGFEKLLPEVLAAEIERGAVREHPKVGKLGARLGLLPPDPSPFLGKAMKELRAVAKKLAPHGVTAAAIHEAIGRALGIERVDPAARGLIDPAADEALVLSALRALAAREPPGALLSVRALRPLVALDKGRFDGAVLRLGRAGELTLHHHDFPASLSEAERAMLVVDERGTHYVGAALRDVSGR